MVNLITNPFQEIKVFEFRNRIMGMSKGESIAEGRKVIGEIEKKRILSLVEQSEDLNKNNLPRQMAYSNKHNPNPQEYVRKVKMVKGKTKMVKTDLRF